MKKGKVKIQRRRVFSHDFKKARVEEYESGEYSIKEISKLFNIKPQILYRWVYRLSNYNKKSTIIVEMKDSATKRLKDYESRIADLERALGQKQLHIDYLEKMIDLAKEHYEIDLKKTQIPHP